MDVILSNLQLNLPSSIYTKDPQQSDLGQRILRASIDMIETEGFENYNFNKLGRKIKSNESSIYRYFRNKHQLLVYLSCWYWAWLEYLIVFETHNLSTPKSALERTISILSGSHLQHSDILDTQKLRAIMIQENGKAYLTHEVDDENKKGYFLTYKNLVARIADILSQYAPKYAYPKNLSVLLLDTVMHQAFVIEHFPSVCDTTDPVEIEKFVLRLVQKNLK